ncbi:hypothetical protein CDIK_4199, partial [Cucumispora dikerogammari]
FDRIKECVSRTTNVSETFHKTINHNSGMASPNLARFCNLLCDAEENARVQLLQIEADKWLILFMFDLKKEYTLNQLVKNFEKLKIESYLALLETQCLL